MTRRRDPERIHLARRAAHVARLGDHGWSREEAEEAATAWETHAGAEGRQRADEAFWGGLEAWATELRRERR
jgi:hypothetical protein